MRIEIKRDSFLFSGQIVNMPLKRESRPVVLMLTHSSLTINTKKRESKEERLEELQPLKKLLVG